jgi:hypothetical protein
VSGSAYCPEGPARAAAHLLLAQVARSSGEETHLARAIVAPVRCGDRNRKLLDGAALTG